MQPRISRLVGMSRFTDNAALRRTIALHCRWKIGRPVKDEAEWAGDAAYMVRDIAARDDVVVCWRTGVAGRRMSCQHMQAPVAPDCLRSLVPRRRYSSCLLIIRALIMLEPFTPHLRRRGTDLCMRPHEHARGLLDRWRLQTAFWGYMQAFIIEEHRIDRLVGRDCRWLR